MNLMRVGPGKLIFALILSGCNMKSNEQLKMENDSLRAQLIKKDQAMQVMNDISALIDSIDVARNVLRAEMVKGIPLSNYSERMDGILMYVKTSEDKIDELQHALKTINNENSGYAMMIGALKNELYSATAEIEILQEQVETVAKKNNELITLMRLQEAELNKNQGEIAASQQELTLFENRIHELMLKANISEADAYFARGEAVYEAAKRTKLAPRKRKETLREALELYKKSFSLGKKDAQARIDELSKKI